MRRPNPAQETTFSNATMVRFTSTSRHLILHSFPHDHQRLVERKTERYTGSLGTLKALHSRETKVFRPRCSESQIERSTSDTFSRKDTDVS